MPYIKHKNALVALSVPLLLFFALVAGISLRDRAAQASPLSAPAAQDSTAVAISLVPPQAPVTVGETFLVHIMVNAGELRVVGVQVFVDFDPAILEVQDADDNPENGVSIGPGESLHHVLANEADNDLGQITFAAGILPGSVTGSFVLATITFRALAETDAQGTILDFSHKSPGSVLVTGGGNRIETELAGAAVVIQAEPVEETPTPAPTSTSTPTPTAVTQPPVGDGGGGGVFDPTSTPTPTHTPTPTPTPTATPTATSTPLPARPEEVEEAPLETAILIVTLLEPEQAADLLSKIDPARAAAIIGRLDTPWVGRVLDALPIASLVDTIGFQDQETLVRILPLMDQDRLLEIPPEVLFDALPQVPADTIVPDVPPQADPDLPPPTAVQVSQTLVIYTVPQTGQLTWTKLVGSPAPIHEVLGKFNRRVVNVEVRVEDLTQPPVNAPDFGIDQVLHSLFRIDVVNAAPQDLVAGYATIYVERSWMTANNIHPWSIRLNRLDQQLGRWVPFPARRAREDESRVIYTVAVPGFSVFAITGSVEAPTTAFEVSGLAISPPQPLAGEDITIRASVTNTNTDTGVYPANLWVNNTLEDSEVVLLGPGETRTVSFTFTRPAGSYSVRIERLLGLFTVVESTGIATATPTPTATATPTPTPLPSPTPTPSATPSPLPTSTPSPTATPANTPSPTVTPTPLPSAAQAPEATVTPAPILPLDAGEGNLRALLGLIVVGIIAIGAAVTLVQIFRRS